MGVPWNVTWTTAISQTSTILEWLPLSLTYTHTYTRHEDTDATINVVIHPCTFSNVYNIIRCSLSLFHYSSILLLYCLPQTYMHTQLFRFQVVTWHVNCNRAIHLFIVSQFQITNNQYGDSELIARLTAGCPAMNQGYPYKQLLTMSPAETGVIHVYFNNTTKPKEHTHTHTYTHTHRHTHTLTHTHTHHTYTHTHTHNTAWSNNHHVYWYMCMSEWTIQWYTDWYEPCHVCEDNIS